MKRFYFLITLLLWGLITNGQQHKDWHEQDSTYVNYQEEKLLPPVAPPNIYLKTNIFSLIEPDMAATLTAEYRPKITEGYQLELGYIYQSLYRIGDPGNTWGYRIKPEWRFYTPGKYFKQQHYVNYWAVETIIKAVYNDFYQFVRRGCNGADGCAYSQKLAYRTSWHVLGIGGKVGKQRYIGTQSFRVILDYYLGLGVRYRWTSNNLPDDADHFNNDRTFIVFGNDDGSYLLPYISAGIKVGFRIK